MNIIKAVEKAIENIGKSYVSTDYIIRCDGEWVIFANNKVSFAIPIGAKFCQQGV